MAPRQRSDRNGQVPGLLLPWQSDDVAFHSRSEKVTKSPPRGRRCSTPVLHAASWPLLRSVEQSRRLALGGHQQPFASAECDVRSVATAATRRAGHRGRHASARGRNAGRAWAGADAGQRAAGPCEKQLHHARQEASGRDCDRRLFTSSRRRGVPYVATSDLAAISGWTPRPDARNASRSR